MKKFFIPGTCAFALAALGSTSVLHAQTVVAKQGTIMNAAIGQTLSSKTSQNGDKFTLSEKNTFFHHDAALDGVVIDGHVENVSPASPTHKATMSLIFDDAQLPDGKTVPFSAQLVSLKAVEPHTHHVRDVGLIVGGAVVGHMFAKQHHGGLAGGAAGFALASSLKSDIKVKSGTVVKLRLTSDLQN